MKILNEIKNYKEFLTVNELDKSLFNLCRRKEILLLGKSNKGHKIYCAKLGKGEENALIFGFPHPNEPIGSLTCLSLIKLIKSHKDLQEVYTWYIVPCADPDGAKLNEGWFKGKFSIKKYVYNYYRPPNFLQAEWAFPVRYKGYSFSKSPKHNKSLKKLIDEIKPSINYPLHNAGFRAAFFLISKPMPSDSYKEIIALCKKLSIPLDMGEPEAPFMKIFKKPIYRVPFFEEFYDFLEKNGLDPKKNTEGGQASIDYVIKLNPSSFGIVGEIPYIYDNKISNNFPTRKSKREILRKRYSDEIENFDFIFDNLNVNGINKNSDFYVMLKNIANWKARREASLNDLDSAKYSKKATVAEKFDSEVISPFYSVLNLGAFFRLLSESRQTKDVKYITEETRKRINDTVDFIDKNSDYKIIPIKNLIQLQIGCLLIFMKYLNKNNKLK